MKHSVGKTKNGIPVYVDLIRSQAALNIAQQPHILALARKIVRQMEATKPEIVAECDLGRTIGYDFVVSTTEKDAVVYARLLRKNIYTRFVKNAQPQTTQYLTITLRLDENNEYELHNAWIGRIRPARPGSTRESTESRPYWASHAFVLSNQVLQTNTVTKTCPY
jgi:hypothetical protein